MHIRQQFSHVQCSSCCTKNQASPCSDQFNCTVSNPIIGKLLTSLQLYLIITDIDRFEPRKSKEFALFQHFVVTSTASDNFKASSVVVTLLLSQKIGEPGMRNLK